MRNRPVFATLCCALGLLLSGGSKVVLAQQEQQGLITSVRWLQFCGGPLSEPAEPGCHSYLQGFHDSAVTLVELGMPLPELQKRLGCIPGNVSIGQLRSVVAKHLRSHPERLHLPLGRLVAEAQRVAFPC